MGEGTVVVHDFSEKVLMYLRKWWINHILVDDMKYKPLFADRIEPSLFSSIPLYPFEQLNQTLCPLRIYHVHM